MIKTAWRNFRQRTFPPSKDDIGWRYDTLMATLNAIRAEARASGPESPDSRPTAQAQRAAALATALHSSELSMDLWRRTGRYDDTRSLSRFDARVYSQNGEDGIIAEIFRRIGATNRVFAECAPGDGSENNTRYLLTQGWTGLWVEGDPKHAQAISRDFAKLLKEGKLRFQQERVTAQNVEALLERASLPAEFDLLSIDLDRNDYWVWQGIQRFRPRVVAIEYNAIFPPGCEWVVEYDPQAGWDGSSNCGASLTALELLGARKGYKLVACSLSGVNAFFVREDLVGNLFCDPSTAQNHYEPPRYYLTARKGGHPRR